MYFNHRAVIAEDRWSRWSFIRHWWRIYQSDPYWTPPYAPTLGRNFNPTRNPHFSRLKAIPLWLEALPRRAAPNAAPSFSGVAIEQGVAAALALIDPRRTDACAHLAWLHCANDADSLARLLDVFSERLASLGVRRLIGPTGLSPHLGSGLLQDCWHLRPPLHTAYNPPYLPELAGNVWRPRSSARLFHLPVLPQLPAAAPSPARLLPLNPARLAGDLLPLLAAACPPWLDFPPPDALEAEFLLRQFSPWPLWGWLAAANGEPAGFILLQPDLAPRLRRANGGRNPLWWLWLRWASRRPAGQGRVLFAAVLPRYRQQGIGRQLLHQALADAKARGWDSLAIGPLPTTAPGSRFLQHFGAEARQTYLLYQRDL